MTKNFFKELIIVLLLLVAIVLLLGIFLYDYIPTNKIVPKIEQYQVPNNIQEELKSTVNDISEEQTKIVYEIDGTDLNNYEKTNDYQKGKVNPFAQDINETQPNAQATSSTTNSSTNANNNTNNSNNNSNVNAGGNNNATSNNTQTTSATNKSNSVGSYLPNTGTK